MAHRIRVPQPGSAKELMKLSYHYAGLFAACRGILVACPLLLMLSGCDDGDSGVVVTGEYPVAWVERALPRDEDTGAFVGDDLRDPGEFRPGARLLMKRRAAPAAPVIDIAGRLFSEDERYDVRDVTASWDGTKFLFALRGPFIEDAQDEDQPTWNIWEYDVDADALRRVIASDLVAEEGQDIMPAYLPDGRIVFSSTRQRASRAVLVDEGKPQYAMLDDTRQNEVFVLHVMNADGTGIRQVTFNGAHDLWPSALPDGRVMFARQVNNRGRVSMHLYRMLPDGRAVEPLFGGASHDTVGTERVEFSHPRVTDDGRVLAIERPFQTDFLGGALALLDVAEFSDEDQPLVGATGEGGIDAIDMAGYPGEALPSRAGRYTDAVPLGDNTGRLLVSWSACRLQPAGTRQTPPPIPPRIVPCAGNDVADAQWEEAPPIYGVFVFDPSDGSRLPVVVPREDTLYEHVAVAIPRTPPPFLPDATPGAGLDSALYDAGVGVLDIRSVYDMDGAFAPLGSAFTSLAQLADPMASTAAQRPARWLRLEKIVAIPDREVRDFRQTAFGVNAANGMREILGYTPVEPDGSVRVMLPANVPFTFSVVDANGRRIGTRHGPWLQLVPGEVRLCAGCHDNASTLPHGRSDAGPAPLNAGAPGGAPFANTDPAKVADAGETMAQLRVRQDADTLAPSFDLAYTDTWTNSALRTPDASTALRYADLAAPAPASEACQATWAPICRATIHYEAHIHPLWSRDRRVFDTDGTTLLRDDTCTSCHTSRDAMDMAQLPAAQLDLRDGYSGQVVDRMNAYQELFAADDAQQIVDGTLVDILQDAVDADGNVIYQTNADGSLILDGNGDPVPVQVTVPVQASLTAGNARASTRFFTRFAPGGTHAGRLADAELRLLSEWVDIGAQYFNDPFLAPLD